MIHGGTMAQPCKLERLVGIITAYVFVWINKYYTDYKHKLPSMPQDWWMNPRAQMLEGVREIIDVLDAVGNTIKLQLKRIFHWMLSCICSRTFKPFEQKYMEKPDYETGALGGKGSDTNKAAFTGETDGDSFKGTAESSLHVRIKIVATITLVMAPIVL
ncbi:hypothetical protein ACOSP7_021365 [Xanthoceras sorbifolium]